MLCELMTFIMRTSGHYLRVERMNPEERYCVLVLDEMSITPCVEFDTHSGSLLGNVTFPGHSGKATHALVFMLSGIPGVKFVIHTHAFTYLILR